MPVSNGSRTTAPSGGFTPARGDRLSIFLSSQYCPYWLSALRLPSLIPPRHSYPPLRPIKPRFRPGLGRVNLDNAPSVTGVSALVYRTIRYDRSASCTTLPMALNVTFGSGWKVPSYSPMNGAASSPAAKQ